MKRRLFLAAALLPAAAAFPASARAAQTSAELDAAIEKRRLAEAVRIFGKIAKPTARDQYLAGHTLIALHRPADARPHLVAAKAAGFVSWPGWPTVDALLARIRTVEELALPQRAIGKGDDAVTVHAGPDTRWNAPVLAAMPEFAAVGRGIFGADLPAIRVYLFPERPAYDRFHAALFGVPVSTAPWHFGTGMTNVVMLCEVDRNGKTTHAAGSPEPASIALHELGHAWFSTYLMDRYDRDWVGASVRAPWLDEGLADCVAALREPAYLKRRQAGLKVKAAAGVAAPSFDELTTYAGFYEKGDAAVHYWIAALFVNELLGPRDKAPATIRRILDEVGRTGGAVASVHTVTGRNPRKMFDEVVRRYW